MKYYDCIAIILFLSVLSPYANALAREKDFPTDDTSTKNQEISEIIRDKILAISGKPFPGGHNFFYGNQVDIRRPTQMVLDDKADPEYIGFVAQFGRRWGGWTQEWKDFKGEHILVEFRNGIIGSCKAIPAYVEEDTEARIRWFSSRLIGFIQRQYIYRNNKWHFVSKKKFKDPPGIGDARDE